MSFADDLARRGRALARQHLSPRARRRLRQLQRTVLGGQTALVARTGLSTARASLGAGEYAEAAARVEAVLRRDPVDEAALELGLRVATKRGAVTEAGSYAVARAELTGLPAHWREARRAVGRARETDPRWRPVVTAPAPRGYRAREGRVLYVAKESRPYLHNGFCTRSHESLRALARAGWDVMGVTEPGFPGTLDLTDGTPAPERSIVEGVTYHHLLPNAGRRLRDLGYDEYAGLAAATLAGVVARERPALLHVSSGHRGYEAALAAGAVARWAGIPWLYEVRSFFETTWTADAQLAETADYPRRRFATETAMMREASLVLTLSSPMRDEIVERHGIPADKVRVVPNGVDLDRFAPRPRDPDLRRRLGLTDTFTLGYVSNLSHPREGQEVLIEAVARLRARGRGVTGLLVGDGGRRPELEQLARRLDVAEHVVFTGNVSFDEVAGHYAQIDLFVVPRVDERAARMVSPMKPFEAMAMRIPVLVADLPALAEIVGSTPGVAGAPRGQVFPAGDAGALAAAAAELMDDVPARQLLVDNAAEWVAAERSWDAVAGAFGQAYADLLRPGRSGREGEQGRLRRTAREGSVC
ncbi:glycosyltransferase family 4 protein [Actinopolymorpha singaporensis]|uniref:Glycosyltransferase involved in cell wall bisynthesis n=1 Tax=Actinopolymorpha singaporensis TaxID=117157 RepID=A0A1H1NVE7_9ACTN|nr:glycosyltransferase family 4 protein [Actinopolymorpha singaporensis]SDS02339.1 Glycosyltransferase involved in cell wall bisynthesis [Actinopolymorpha singaporensis]